MIQNIAEDLWNQIQKELPITCVDVLPLQCSETGPRNGRQKIGLIFRDMPSQGQRWCLVGGRLGYGESFAEAIRRQLLVTLGENVEPIITAEPEPLYVAQYSPSGKFPFGLDPRQHSVGITFGIEIRGVPIPQGEASRFEWFDIENLPSEKEFGFNQDRAVNACLKWLKTNRI